MSDMLFLVEVYEEKPSLIQRCLVEKGRYFNGFLKKLWMFFFDSTLTSNERSFLKISCNVESETMLVDVSVTPKPRVCPALWSSLLPTRVSQQRVWLIWIGLVCVWSHADLPGSTSRNSFAHNTGSLHHWQLSSSCWQIQVLQNSNSCFEFYHGRQNGVSFASLRSFSRKFCQIIKP